jgi:polysaccharide export outer membrane protein
MNGTKLILVIIFLMFTAILFITLPPHGFAQRAVSLEQLAIGATQQITGSSSSTDLTSGSEVQKYYDFASEFQRQNLTDGLSPDERGSIFEGLDDDGKRNLFKLLSTSERLKLFSDISDDDKKNMFKTLNNTDRQNLFAIIDDSDKKRILDDSSSVEKSMLIESLPVTERNKWLAEYPALEKKGVSPKEIFEISEEGYARLSSIEKVLSGKFPTDISRVLTQFGYNYFSQGPSSFVPERTVPVGPNYIIGPDDRFTINLWGKAEESYYVTVSRDGRITLPRLGSLEVGGLTLSELKSFLLNKFKEYYPDFEMSITMGTLRTVDVFIIGELGSPGTYSLTSLSTVISALFASGGPSKNGTLRDIRVIDQGELITTIDLYEFFIKGTKANDIRLKQGYTIFIPVIGPVVGIAGHVKRPAIYETKDERTIGDIIELAGGVLPSGHLQNVVVERIIGHQRRVIKSFNLDPRYEKSDLNLKTPIKDGDVIKIYPIYERMEQLVYLEGHVKYPGEYELRPGMRLADIVSSFDCLLPEPYLQQAEIIRLIPPDLHPEIIEFNLGSLLSGDEEQNLLLQDQDRIKLYGLWEKRDIPEVTISGALRNPGTYRLYKDMTIKDLIFQAGNLTNTAHMDNAELTRIVQGSTGTDTIKLTFSPQRAMEGDTEDNMVLQKDDYVQIREIPKYAQALERRISLEGEFVFPGTYSFSEGERLSSVIERAGGLTEEAYSPAAIFLRESVKNIQRERQREYISKLEEDILTLSTYSAETAFDTSQAALLQQTLSAKRELIEKLKASEPTGRMVIRISDIMLMPSSDYDIVVKPGDRLIVGKRPQCVNVMGEVYNPNALLVQKGKDVVYYLNLVGGPTDTADEKQLYIVKADGTVISKRQEKFGLFNWDILKHRWTWGSFNSIEPDPGDTIIVPKKIEKIGWLKYTKDVTGILYEIAVAAGVLHEIFTD